MAGRRSGASEEKEGERGIFRIKTSCRTSSIKPQHRVLLQYYVLGRPLRSEEIYVAERAVELGASPPDRALPQHLPFQVVQRAQAERSRSFRNELVCVQAGRPRATLDTGTLPHQYFRHSIAVSPREMDPEETNKKTEGIASGLCYSSFSGLRG